PRGHRDAGRGQHRDQPRLGRRSVNRALRLHPSQLLLVGGKGGVGKTTTAAALALSLADAGDHVVVLSVDPAHSLADAFASPLGPDPTPIAGLPTLSALEVDAELERRRFLAEHGDAL